MSLTRHTLSPHASQAPIGRALEIVEVLERGLERSPAHPLAMHLLVHATESLPPGRGINTAGRWGQEGEDKKAVCGRAGIRGRRRNNTNMIMAHVLCMITSHVLVQCPCRSPRSGRGEPSGDLLSSGFQSLSHLTHMASHVYYRVGRWEDGVAVNRRAVEIDARDAKR